MKSKISACAALIYLILSGLLSTGCKKNNLSSDDNHPPVAFAGHDQIVVLESSLGPVTLKGSASDPDNNISGYLWSFLSGPNSTSIQNPAELETDILPTSPGDYQFSLKVTDSGGLYDLDTVSITVKPFPNNHWNAMNQLPANEFFYEPRNWYNGSNFLMGIGDQVFAISNHGSLWKYSETQNTWQNIGMMPLQSDAIVLFSISGKGYIMGNGFCWSYDPLSNQWLQKNNAPSYFKGGLPLLAGNKVYIISQTGMVVEYDPASDNYSQKANHPGSDVQAGFVINGEAYSIQATGKCYKYVVVTDSWQQKASLPPSITHMTGFSFNQHGYIIGDHDNWAYNLNYPMLVWRYSPQFDQWYQMSEPYPGNGTYEIGAVTVNGKVYAGLGYTNGDFNAIDFYSFQ